MENFLSVSVEKFFRLYVTHGFEIYCFWYFFIGRNHDSFGKLFIHFYCGYKKNTLNVIFIFSDVECHYNVSSYFCTIRFRTVARMESNNLNKLKKIDKQKQICKQNIYF